MSRPCLEGAEAEEVEEAVAVEEAIVVGPEAGEVEVALEVVKGGPAGTRT